MQMKFMIHFEFKSEEKKERFVIQLKWLGRLKLWTMYESVFIKIEIILFMSRGIEECALIWLRTLNSLFHSLSSFNSLTFYL